MRRILIATLLGLGALIVLGAVTQTFAILAPLRKLREDVANRWRNNSVLDVNEYPIEVAPLVQDLNMLISGNRERAERSRRQAADLAHVLKTPSAILRNELQAFQDKGVDTHDASLALGRIDAQISRSLSRLRAAGSDRFAVEEPASLSTAVTRLSRLFQRLASSEGKDFEAEVPEALDVFIDPHDLEEMLGTVLENAFKWCQSKVRLSATEAHGFAEIRIEDDGPGIPPEHRETVLDSGERLDLSKPGTGLGLTIVNDMASGIGGRIELTDSEALTGLSVVLYLPSRRNAALGTD